MDAEYDAALDTIFVSRNRWRAQTDKLELLEIVIHEYLEGNQKLLESIARQKDPQISFLMRANGAGRVETFHSSSRQAQALPVGTTKLLDQLRQTSRPKNPDSSHDHRRGGPAG